MLINNEQLIKRKYNWVLDKINAVDDNKAFSNIVVEKNTGRAPTVFIADADKKLYLHSKYNPYEEAKRIIDNLDNIGNYGYVVFWGFALGYHVEYFINKFPDIHFSIFEPKLDIFKKCLENRDISFIENSNFDSFYFTDIDAASEIKLEEFLSSLNCDILIIPLISYETAFPDEYNNFYKKFGQYFNNTAIVNNTKKHNEKLHTVNALNNFSFILNTPNILRQDSNLFRNKPAILVSAGPSLEYEIENLRYIKKNDLAYIFSAGSAINALIENNAYPHACWSIEPNEQSSIVYKKMISRGIKSIPLIFGSTTSSAVVKSYPGNLYHFITSKDLVAPYFLDNISSDEIVDTASSVSVVALLALHKLGFSPIILVGQNLAYKDQRYYSSGIDHNKGSDIIESDYFEHLYKVQSVDGGYVYSDDALNCFRKDMEYYIRRSKIDNVINTTRTGAAIKGTTYMTLDKLIKDNLKDKTVDPQWELKLKINYNRNLIKIQAASIKAEIDNFYIIIQRLKDLSDRINSTGNKNIPGNLSTLFCKIFDDIINNKFFHVFLYSMNAYECKMLIKDIKLMKNHNASSDFSVSLLERFIDFINICLMDLDIILPLIKDLDEKLS